MADMGNNVRGKKSNIVYSFLVFLALFSLGVAVLDPTSLQDTSKHIQPSSKAFFVFALSIALAVVFSMWYGKKSQRK